MRHASIRFIDFSVGASFSAGLRAVAEIQTGTAPRDAAS
jgi:hypothetical protein